MLKSPAYRSLILTWLGWSVVLLVFQAIVPARLSLARPDNALEWTAKETLPGSQDKKIYLNEPFLNSHVSWDSEYYLAIAVGGYEDPAIHRIGGSFFGVSEGEGRFWPFIIPLSARGVSGGIPLSYAFYPLYPLAIRLVSVPLGLLGMNRIATAALGGVLVSLAGTLAGMLALYELARQELGEDGGLRAAFYLLIFPSSFFLAQVYTEGLFIGLAFASLVMIRRGRRGWAALLAVLATFTRAVGVVLFIPLLLSWIKDGEWLDMDMEWRELYTKGLPLKKIGRALVAFAPLVAFFLWRISYYGMAFGKVEEEYFGRGLFLLGMSFVSWAEAFRDLFGNNPQAAAYYAIEWGAILLALVACIAEIRCQPDVAWFGLLVVLLSLTSGPAQGMHRYVLAAPPLFIFLSRLGRHQAFDRTWTVLSILLMGLLATLFTFDMWAG